LRAIVGALLSRAQLSARAIVGAQLSCALKTGHWLTVVVDFVCHFTAIVDGHLVTVTFMFYTFVGFCHWPIVCRGSLWVIRF